MGHRSDLLLTARRRCPSSGTGNRRATPSGRSADAAQAHRLVTSRFVARSLAPDGRIVNPTAASLSRAGELAVVPGDDAGRPEAEGDALLRLLEHLGARLGRRVAAGVARHQAEADVRDLLGVALDRHVALEHGAAELLVAVAPGLGLDGRARVALEGLDLLRLPEGPGGEHQAVPDVPEGHEVRAAVRAEARDREHALLVEEALQRLLGHPDLAAA